MFFSLLFFSSFFLPSYSFTLTSLFSIAYVFGGQLWERLQDPPHNLPQHLPSFQRPASPAHLQGKGSAPGRAQSPDPECGSPSPRPPPPFPGQASDPARSKCPPLCPAQSLREALAWIPWTPQGPGASVLTEICNPAILSVTPLSLLIFLQTLSAVRRVLRNQGGLPLSAPEAGEAAPSERLFGKRKAITALSR